MQCVNCLVAFGCNQFADISIQSIEYLTRCAAYLAKLAADSAAAAAAGRSPHHITDIHSQHAAGADGADTKTAAPASASAVAATGVEGASPTVTDVKTVLARATSHDGSAGAAASGSGDEPHLRVWFLLLTGLAKLIGDGRLQVRSRALQALFTTLLAHGHLFSLQTWRLIFRGVLFPIFDDVRHVVVTRRPQQNTTSTAGAAAAVAAVGNTTATGDAPPPPLPPRPQTPSRPKANSAAGPAPFTPGGPPGGKVVRKGTVNAFVTSDDDDDPYAAFEDDWLSTTCLAALSTLVELFVRFHRTIHSLLPDLLALIDSCIDQPSEDLARIGIKCWSLLIRACASQLNADHWTIVAGTLSSILRRTLPTQLVGPQLRQYLRLDVAAPNPPPPNYPPPTKRNSPALAPAVSANKPDALPAGVVGATASADTTTAAAASASTEGTPATTTTPTSTTAAAAATATDSAAGSAPPTPLTVDAKAATTAVAAAPTPKTVKPVQPAPAAAASGPTGPGILQVSATWNAELAVTRCRVHLILMDAAFEVLSLLFPRFTTTKREPTTGETGAAAGSDAKVESSPIATYRVRRSTQRTTYSQYLTSLKRPRSDSLNGRDAAEAERDAKEQAQKVAAANAAARAGAAAAPVPVLSTNGSIVAANPISGSVAGSAGSHAVVMELDSKSPVQLTATHLCTILGALNESVAFARTFNSDKELRRRLHAAGLMRKTDRTLPELYFQESRALKISIAVLTKMYSDEISTEPTEAADAAQLNSELAAADGSGSGSGGLVAAEDGDVALSDAELRLLSLQWQVLREYIGRARRSDPEEVDGLHHMSSVVASCLDGFLRFSPRQFCTHLSQFYPLWMELVAVGSVEIRSVLRKLLLTRVGKLMTL